MGKDEIIALLETVVVPIYQIEENLGMPKTTLQKAIKGERELPKKWALKLLEVYPKKEENNKPEILGQREVFIPKNQPVLDKFGRILVSEKKIKKEKGNLDEIKKQFPIEEIPRLKGENSIEYRLRMIEENKK